VLAAAPAVHKWAIYERAPLPAWSKGNVVLIGDACHPMTPYMASGAAMALEDAVVLARSIDEADTLETAFHIYESTRKPRASTVQAGSSANSWMRTETNPDWLYGYDAARVPLRTSVAAEASTYYEA
jgi:salicylate hydroxylase/6-hydroxynicotinate 3-monooxygenase